LALFFNRKDNFTLITLLLFSLFAFFYMQRNSSFFTLTCAYIIVEGAKRTGFNDIWKRWRYVKPGEYVIFIVITLYLFIQILNFLNHKSYFNGQLIYNRSLVANPLTEVPIKLLIKNKITGPVFNQDVLGAQMIWLGYPGLRPFVDSRNSSKERFVNSIAILSNPVKIWPQAQKDYKFKIVMLNMDNNLDLQFIKYLSAQSDWQLISVNGPIVTYVKRGEFYLPIELNGFEDLLKSHNVSDDNLRTLQKFAVGKNVSTSQEAYDPYITYIDLFSTSLTLFRLGYSGAAADDLVKVSMISDQLYIRKTAGLIIKQLASSPNL